ncbi:Spy/CpxP family protein refolding chaperone [Plebeiibacterium sediminum]|uniref:Periplasmic heavy metal sensor n=1 Tax=Plebeiibacterium sediminum TaxID=2992112 RepID=A0AAE3SFU7_9BACT|nr:hypothetical protein [Plebeiobacterium sediminum]MCW3786573.1 hypothetical protein [Plebeiobacterium sediminum]
MNKNASRILIYVVIFLAVLNVATFTSIGIHVYQSKKELPQASSEAIKTTQNFNGRYFRDQLNLSPDQMNQFRKINEKFRSNARRINSELNMLRADMLNQMKNTSEETETLISISDSIGSLHSELKKFTYQYYLDIKSICSGEQINGLNEIFENFFAGSETHNGRGNQKQGKGFGKNRHDNN